MMYSVAVQISPGAWCVCVGGGGGGGQYGFFLSHNYVVNPIWLAIDRIYVENVQCRSLPSLAMQHTGYPRDNQRD